MVNLYNEKQIETFEKRKKKSLIFIFLPLAIVLPSIILFNILVKTNTRALFITLSSLVLAAYAINLVYQIMENLILSDDKIKHIKNITKKETKILEGEIKLISELTTIQRNIKIYEITIDVKEQSYRVYINADFEVETLKIGSKVKFGLVDNFVKEYEVINEK